MHVCRRCAAPLGTKPRKVLLTIVPKYFMISKPYTFHHTFLPHHTTSSYSLKPQSRAGQSTILVPPDQTSPGQHGYVRLLLKQSKDAASGFKGRKRPLAAANASQVTPSLTVPGDATLDVRVGGGGGRPPTAPSHGPGRRTGVRPTTNADGSPCATALVSAGSVQKVSWC